MGIAKFAFLFKVKSVSFLLITSDYGDTVYGKTTPSTIENKTQPSLCLQTWLQQNLRISTNHKYRIYMDVFLQPDVLKNWRSVNLTFCKPDVLLSWRFVNLTFQMFWNRTFWTWCFETWRFVGVPSVKLKLFTMHLGTYGSALNATNNILESLFRQY